MKYLILAALLLTGCASNPSSCDSGGFSYGPGDWLADNWGWNVSTPCNSCQVDMSKVDVIVHSDSDELWEACQPSMVKDQLACTQYLGGDRYAIHLPERYSENLLNHEKCHVAGKHKPLPYSGTLRDMN